MKSFNVIVYDFNSRKFEAYDIMPYLVNCYESSEHKPTTFEEFKEFVQSRSLCQWWSRCEYEVVLSDWPCQQDKVKIDVYYQITLNMDIITEILIENIKINYEV